MEYFLILLLCGVVAAELDYCAPGIVPNVTFDSKNILRWSPVMNPANCQISGYIINVFDNEHQTKLEFQLPATILAYNLSILETCDTYDFEVKAITKMFVVGPSAKISAKTYPPSSLNLELSASTAAVDRGLQITWNLLKASVAKCVSQYRVVLWDENNKPKDVYVPNNNFYIMNMIPCMTYKVQINAIVTNPDLEGPTTEIEAHGPATAPPLPKLLNMTTNSTAVSMQWRLPSIQEYRCPLVSLEFSTPGIPSRASTKITTVTLADSAEVRLSNVVVTIDQLMPLHVYSSYVLLRSSGGASKRLTISFQTSDQSRMQSPLYSQTDKIILFK